MHCHWEANCLSRPPIISTVCSDLFLTSTSMLLEIGVTLTSPPSSSWKSEDVYFRFSTSLKKASCNAGILSVHGHAHKNCLRQSSLAVDLPVCVDSFLPTPLTSVNSFTCLGRSSPNNWSVIASDEEQRCFYSSCRSDFINSLRRWGSSLFALANKASASVADFNRSFSFGISGIWSRHLSTIIVNENLVLSTRLIKPNFCFDLSHRRSTTVSWETRNLS